MACFQCATDGTRPHSRVPSLLHLAAIACCFLRATAGTRPGVGKHSVRAFHSSAHARLLSVLSATERRLAFSCCDNVVIVGWRPTALRIKNSERFEVSWFGRITSGILRISMKMASDLQKNFVGAASWRIPFAWSRRCGTTTAFTTACTTSSSTSPPLLTTSSTRFYTLCPAADQLTVSTVATAIVAFDKFVSDTGTNQTRRREIRGRIVVSTRNTW